MHWPYNRSDSSKEDVLPQRAFKFMVHPTAVCVSDDPTVLGHPLMPRWEFRNAPPESSPELVLPKGKGKVGVWSVKHRCTYLGGLGFLVGDQRGDVHLVESTFFSGGDLDYSSNHSGFHFHMTLTINNWELPQTPCECHRKFVG